MTSELRKQSGVALITALLITALVTVAAVSMASRQQLDIRRTGNLMEADQAWQYALGVEAWARQVLAADDAKRDTMIVEHDNWNLAVPPLPVEGGSVKGSVEDLQGRFNLNNVLQSDGMPDPTQVQMLQILLDRVAATDDKLSLPPFAADVVVDWLDTLPDVYRNGAEDGAYLGMEPVPYRAANRRMESPSELLALVGFSPRAVAALTQPKPPVPPLTQEKLPLVATLPASKVNVNTAQDMVLMSLNAEITQQQANTLMGYRTDTPFDSAADFSKYMKDKLRINVDPGLVTVKSEYFLVKAVATIGRTKVELYSVLKRSATDNTITTIQRSIGVY